MTATRPRKNRIVVNLSSLAGKNVDLSALVDGMILVYDETTDSFVAVEPSVYEPIIEKSIGYFIWNGSAIVFVNETYSLSTHNHDSAYQTLDADLTAIAALAGNTGLLRKTAANTWSLDTATYLTGITKSMVEAVLTGTITSHNHDGAYLTAITKAMVEAVLTGTITSHDHSGVYQPLDADLTAIAALAGTTGLLRKTAANTWSLETATYLTANQNITLSGDASGSGATSIAVTITGLMGAALPTLTSGYLRYTGSAWLFLNETYLTAITKAMVEAVLTGAITTHTHAYEPVITKATGYTRWTGSAWQFLNETYLTAITKAMVEAVLTGTINSHNHSGTYEVPLTFSTGLNRDTNTITLTFGTTAGTACQGNDSRLSDTRTPTDSTVSYAKVASDLTSRQAISASDVDWSTGGVYTKTLSAATTFTFSNLKLNKTITMVVAGNYTIEMPTYAKRISGTYDGATTNYIQLHCTNAASGSEEVWYTISKQAT